eukprot:TRINITY_DN228_c0_g2_i1.p1 TRINITY_DN228_c0_g2~~TRINITY_DN228_c0_g2_i1.p1  ORF type:complete len:492 (+),score=-20.40 TRINITY_DN228_c0_g2_i1:79-1554(+)
MRFLYQSSSAPELLFRMDKYDPCVQELENHGWFIGARPVVSRFRTMSSGALLPFSADDSRSDIFLSIFDLESRRNIAKSTTSELLSSETHSAHRSLSLPELQKFIAVRLVPRVDPRRTLEDYWASSEDESTPPNAFMASRMSLHRFCSLNANIRFDYRQTLSAIVKNSLALRDPGTVICWDESMILYEGADCPFKVYIPRKPDPEGIEVIDMCDEQRFICGLSIRDENGLSNIDRVRSMLGELRDASQHRFYFDRGYGSTVLAEQVATEFGCEFIMKCPINKTEYVFQNCLSCFAMRSRPLAVPMSATKTIAGCPLNAVSIANMYRPSRRGSSRAVALPTISNIVTNCWGDQMSSASSGKLAAEQDYSKHFWIIDRVNQVLQANKYPHRHSNYYAAIFDFALGVSLLNAYVIFKQRYGVLESFRDFIRHVAHELSPDTATTQHTLVPLGVKRHCAWCRRHGVWSNTTLCCGVCLYQPPLHRKCFVPYHASL